MVIVKVHGVLPSSHRYSVSSRKLQFQKVGNGDSGIVVTSLIPAHTQWANDYATLGPSELQPPLTGGYFCAKSHSYFPDRRLADVRHYTWSINLAMSCVLSEQSPPAIACQLHIIDYISITQSPSLSQSYRVKLQSSFAAVFSYALVYLHNPTSVGFITVIPSVFFLKPCKLAKEF